jgi:adenosylmethionine-8-amino-7-oxononanoate aminotransferase
VDKVQKDELIKDDRKYVWHPFTQMNEWAEKEPEQLIIERGDGSYLIDIDENRYLDGVSSLWTNIHGHNVKEINEAMIEQINKISHTTLLGLSSPPSIKLAKKLVEVTPKGLNHVFYSDSGSTAVEIALKMAFQYWQQTGFPNKKRFVYFENSYHGDTIGSVSVGGIDTFHKKYRPLLFKSYKASSTNCYRCKCEIPKEKCKEECFKETEKLLKNNHETIAAVIIEPAVQGAGGMLVWKYGLLAKLKELCLKYNILLITDEVATGFGRTGKMFACDLENVTPDIMTIAKGITGGYLPLAATLATDRIYEAFLGKYEEHKTFYHGHTYTGNPVACSAALASLKLFESNQVLKNLEIKIAILSNHMQKFALLKNVGEVRQKGFMVGIELVQDKGTKRSFPPEKRVGYSVILAARKHGIIIRQLGDVIVLMPPLSISEEELADLTAGVYEAVKEVIEG